MGDLGIVPRKNEQILSNYEKMKLGHPQKELDSLKKLTRKTVGTQTIDFTRVFNLVYSFFFCLIILINIKKASIFGVEFSEVTTQSTQIHPIFDQQERRSLSKSKVLMPINGQNRVTDKVF